MATLKNKFESSLIKPIKLKKSFKIFDLDKPKELKAATSYKNINIIVLYSEYNLSIKPKANTAFVFPGICSHKVNTLLSASQKISDNRCVTLSYEGVTTS